MTSDDRNRRMKHGHDVPRCWIPEFHNTHKKEGENEKSATSQRPAAPSGDDLLRTAKLQGTRQQLFEQQRRWAEQHISNPTAASREREKSSTNDRYALKRRSRQMKQMEQKRLLNRDIRIVQWILAGFFSLIGGLGGGIVGLVFGAAIGLLLMSFRLEI
jgi:hypothetical protein